MSRAIAITIPLLLAAVAAGAEEKPLDDEKLLSGMSIVGNDEAPKSLVIVPWKSSDLGSALDVMGGLDSGRQPVDRDVFARELDYYELRAGSGNAPGSGAE